MTDERNFVSFSADPTPDQLRIVEQSDFQAIIVPVRENLSARKALPIGENWPKTVLRLRIDRFAEDDALVAENPDVFGQESSSDVHDPRNPQVAAGEIRARLQDAEPDGQVADSVAERLESLLEKGAAGFVFDGLEPNAAPFYRRLLERLRSAYPDAVFVAATPGLPRDEAEYLAAQGFDYCLSSFGWWDLKARWLLDEHAALSRHCPLLAEITPSAANRTTDPAAAQALVLAAQFTGSGLIVPVDFLASLSATDGPSDLIGETNLTDGTMEPLTSVGSRLTGIVRYDSASQRDASRAAILLVNLADEHAKVPSNLLDGLRFRASEVNQFAALEAREARVIELGRHDAIAHKPRASKKAVTQAANAPRIVVENLEPSVAGGEFAVKCVVGERIEVSADIYTDGHEMVGARLLWRAERDSKWNAVPMLEEGNDEWHAAFTPERLGRHEYTVEAWDDRFGYYRESIVKKVDAGVAQEVDFTEGRQFLERAAGNAKGAHKRAIENAMSVLEDAQDDQTRAAALTDPALVDAMDALDPHHHSAKAPVQLVDAERREARFSSWYELFPRSMTDDKSRHGNLRDVIDHLPRVRAMGFDTLYFPPIHPIGQTNRKGPNNTLTPDEGDPGSPYAIGSAEGGHDALHPELGTLDDFRALVGAAKDHGLELALDFAIQCSPDHPWLKEHPGWFSWRPDGSMKYAENPPKKYQDIVNVDFYGPDAVPDLWIALRDVVLFWVGEGVKVFRVDNPHTKPLPFWEWMIREVREEHPDVIFLSEAFTRPKVMYRLAKVGFSQSYTYFTWRNSKAELTEYIEELTSRAPKDFFRPHFFVNTPDINPVFLQTGGRPAHRIRAVLAATLSGLWGVYSGFELCDATPLPGKEEYLDSEKFEVRPRDWRTPGDIVEDVTLLNCLRRGHPALQTHLNTKFYAAYDDNVIYYGKPSPDDGDMILVMVNMDPHNAHDCDFEVPLWEFGLPDDGSIAVEDLVNGERFEWTGKMQSIHLTPDEPYRIWRVESEGGARG
ncbi:maltotransferase domain-containing protein [Erythrobacter sp.]|uniref:alpha-1,4-glucan--maltose-1-phosphate maltosyltransferase n=1 Tax=Erythrobacter sp. TaxID=1042 RepID=UPI003C741706